MLLAKIKILFYSNSSNATGYNCEMITSATFKLDCESYYIGFFQPLENIKEYKFQKEYLVNIKFPSINYETYCEYEKKWEVDTKLNICMGKKTIGTGELIEYKFSEIA